MSEDKAPRPLRWLSVRHVTDYAYDAPVELAHHLACLRPRCTLDQDVRDWRLSITPAPDGWMDGELVDPDAPEGLARGQLSTDPWGNGRLVFSHSLVHERLTVSSSFEAGVRAAVEPDVQSSPAWEEVAAGLRYRAGTVATEAVEFTLASSFAPHEGSLAAFGRGAFVPGVSLAAGALALMQRIHAGFRYAPAATSVATRAPEALAGRQGVCQDFAHVMIGACRSLGLAARYVSGYLLTRPPPGKPRLIGADASHAWVQVWCPVHGWIALDPTNGTLVGQDHVTLAWGRDYADVAPLRGVIRGGGNAEPKVAVTVEPIEGRSEGRSEG